MGYHRTTPLPEHSERFEEYYLRYNVDRDTSGGVCSITAEVWEVAEWSGVNPVFYNAGPRGAITDPREAEPLFDLWVKGGGCAHLRMPYLHFDNIDELAACNRVIAFVYNDIADRHNLW